jgi:hypothetical protein
MAAKDIHDIGDTPIYEVAFTNAAGAPSDPTEMTFMLKKPDGTETSYVYGAAAQVVRSGVGTYQFTVPTLVAAGQYVVRAKGTAGIITAVERAFGVRVSAFTNP